MTFFIHHSFQKRPWRRKGEAGAFGLTNQNQEGVERLRSFVKEVRGHLVRLDFIREKRVLLLISSLVAADTWSRHNHRPSL